MSFPPHLKGMYSQNSRSLHQNQTAPMQALQQQPTATQQPQQQQQQQPWNKRTQVMGSYMQANGSATASAIAPNAVGTISASALRRGEQQSMDANVRLPAAPSQPPNMRQQQPQQQQQPLTEQETYLLLVPPLSKTSLE